MAPGNQNSLLSAQAKGVLKTAQKSEKRFHADHKETALDRIANLYIRDKFPTASERDVQRRAEVTYQACKRVLRGGPLTTNISATLFLNEGFYNSTELKTVWTTKTGKGMDYFSARQTVEEGVFGYKIDWSVPVSVAARDRPVYAGLNFSNHPYGAAPAYGSVVLFLKDTLHPRCTFMPVDTYDNRYGLASKDISKDAFDKGVARARNEMVTDNRIGNLCAVISDRQLKALCQISDQSYVIGDDPPNYIEAHIHGGATWARDLDHIRIAASGQTPYLRELGGKHKPATFKYLVSEWAKRYGVRASIWDKNTKIEDLN